MKNASIRWRAIGAKSAAKPHVRSLCSGALTSILGALALAGCTTAPPITQLVDVPVYVPCVADAPARPVFEFDKLPLDAPDGAKVLALARDWPRGRAYEGKLEAALAGCLPAPGSSNAASAAPQSIRP